MQIPLFRSLLEFMFHWKTTYLMIGLMLYNAFSCLICSILYIPVTPMVLATQLFLPVYSLVFFLGMMILYKGFLFGQTTRKKENKSELPRSNSTFKPSEAPSIFKKDAYNSMHWQGILKQLWNKAVAEFKGNNISQTQSSVSLLGHSHYCIGYHELMSVACKYLTRHIGKGKHITIHRPVHRWVLLLMLFVLPPYLYVVFYAGTYGYSTYTICSLNIQPICFGLLLFASMTLGCLTYFLEQYLFACSCIVGLVGLSYGAEIAHQMARLWIKRFDGLRRLNVELDVSEENCEKQTNHKGNESVKENTSVDSSSDSNVESDLRLHLDRPEEVQELLLLIKQDSFENFLFMREFMSEASHLWSISFTSLALFALYLVILASYRLSDQSNLPSYDVAAVVIYCITRTLILVILPIHSITHANAYMLKLQDMFCNCSPKDFSLIGGRDLWLGFLSSAPPLWSIYGVYITYERLIGLLSTSVVAIAAFLISFYSGVSID
jgi:hypothetical protein